MSNLRTFIILIFAIFSTAPFAATATPPSQRMEFEDHSERALGTGHSPAVSAYDDNKVVGLDADSTSPYNIPRAPFGEMRRRAEKVLGKCDLHGKKDATCDKSQCKPDENCMSGKRGGCQMRKNIGGFKKPYACTLCRCIIR
ncbi:hypothetical protein PG999_003801 [Apiospora kogelbergensis]|uniref:Uncharacterized protein n=1 Tax=Apiospora kogelbergensis TaxID=1337665 RepID=A0AAW0R4H8_9PEZI